MSNCIVAPQPDAVEAGAAVLQRGGNAIDAAVTAALVQGVVDPQMCGLGGYAVLDLHLAGADGSIGMDAPALAGAKVSPDMWVDKVIGPNPFGWGFFLEEQVNEVGYTSICTPGTVKMFTTVLERWGTIGWAEAAAPAIRLAEEGFAVGQRLSTLWRTRALYDEGTSMIEIVRRNPEASRIYLHEDGEPYYMGETIRNPDYARSLRHIAEHGAEDFYHGEMAARMAADLAENGSYVTAEDFAAYHLREDTSVVGTFHDYTLSSAGPPHGGATLLAILNIVEGYDLAAMGHNSPDYIHTVSMAMKAAFADRNQHVADPAFVDVPVAWMTSKERAAAWRDHIAAGEPIDASFGNLESPHTTHVTVVDAAGNCVALTHSLGSSSGVITPGLGFMYNNSMINFHPLPGHPNSIAPKKGRTTGMAPTIVYRKDERGDARPLLVLGAPGATRIITSLAQVILNVLVFGMGVEEAVHAPRFDCQVGPIYCQRRIPTPVVEDVARRHPAVHIPYSRGGMALVHAIHIDPETGQRRGAADPGADGMAMAV